MSALSSPEMCRASATTAAWPRVDGAAIPILPEPSLPTALPRITPTTGSPSRTASSRSLSTTTPAPEPNTVPLASASKLRQWPSGDSTIPGSYPCRFICGTVALAAPARATSHSPLSRLCTARCTANSPVAQAA